MDIDEDENRPINRGQEYGIEVNFDSLDDEEREVGLSYGSFCLTYGFTRMGPQKPSLNLILILPSSQQRSRRWRLI